MLSNNRVAAEDGGTGIDDDMVLELWMPLNALDGKSALIRDERLRAQGHTLVDLDVIADAGGFTDDNACAVIDEEVGPDLGTWMDIGARALVSKLRDHAGKQRNAHVVKHVRDTLERHRASVDALSDREARLYRLCELHVAEQVVHLARTTVVQDAWAGGQELTIHGCVYGIEDGLLRTLDIDLGGGSDVAAVATRAFAAIASRDGRAIIPDASERAP